MGIAIANRKNPCNFGALSLRQKRRTKKESTAKRKKRKRKKARKRGRSRKGPFRTKNATADCKQRSSTVSKKAPTRPLQSFPPSPTLQSSLFSISLFSFFLIFLAFCALFLASPRILGASRREKPCLLAKTLAFSKKASKGWRVRVLFPLDWNLSDPTEIPPIARQV